MNWKQLLGGAAIVAAAAAPALADAKEGDAAPDFAGTWTNHESTTLAGLRGHVVLVGCRRVRALRGRAQPG